MTDRTDIWPGRISSFSSTNGSCVEVAHDDDLVYVRNSNRPGAGTLTFTRAEFAAWLEVCKAGEHDDLT